MESMRVASSDKCPFEFNFDAATFKVGDVVSYSVEGRFEGAHFPGKLLEVGEDYVVVSPQDLTDPDRRMRGTRANRPVVSAKDALE